MEDFNRHKDMENMTNKLRRRLGTDNPIVKYLMYMKGVISSLEEDYDSLEIDFEEKEERVNFLENELGEKEYLIGELQDEIYNLSSDNEKLENHLKEAEDEVDRLEKLIEKGE